jgi:hypothetical protein
MGCIRSIDEERKAFDINGFKREGIGRAQDRGKEENTKK